MQKISAQVRTSVDHTVDHSYLDCARHLLVGSQDHVNTKSAVTNLSMNLTGKAKLNLIGHGMVGLINTGPEIPGARRIWKRASA